MVLHLVRLLAVVNDSVAVVGFVSRRFCVVLVWFGSCFVSFRFVSFRLVWFGSCFVSFRFVSFRFVSFPHRRLQQTCRLTPGVPVSPMLAKPTKSIAEVMQRLSGQEFTCEYK